MPTIPAPNPLRTEAVLPVVVCFLVVTATVGTTVVGAGAPAPNPDPDRPAAAGAEDPRPESSPRPANDRRPSEPVRQAGATATDRTNRSDDGSAIGSTVDGENGTENRTGDGTVGASAGGTGNGSSSAASPAALDPTAVPSGDWPNLFRDAGQTAVNPRSDAPDSFPEVRWSTGFGSTPSSPVATDGRLYLNVGGDVLHAVDRQSGDIDWTNASNVQDFAPVVADGSVVTYPRTGGFFFVTQNMAAYAADSGRQQWSITPEGISSWITAPVVGDGTIYLGYDTRVSAYAAGSGEHQWTRPLQDQPRAPLLTSNGQVYVRQVNGNFSAFDADDGSPEWNVSLGVESLAAQAATDRAVFVANGSGIAALAHGDGSRVWGVGGFSRTGAMVAGEETVYASLKNDTASGVLAVDASTGERQWWQPEVGQSFTDTDRMAAIDGILYVATDGGTLYALDRDDGGIRWSWDRTRPLQYPVPIDDSLYVVGGSTLYALEDRDVDAGIAVGSPHGRSYHGTQRQRRDQRAWRARTAHRDQLVVR